jgi:hypothetical protein
MGNAHSSVQSLSPSLRSVSGPAGPLVGFFKSSWAGLALGSTDRGSKKRRKIERSVAKRTPFLPLQAPCNQRGLCGHRVMLSAKGRLLANALGPGDGPKARRLRTIEQNTDAGECGTVIARLAAKITRRPAAAAGPI